MIRTVSTLRCCFIVLLCSGLSCETGDTDSTVLAPLEPVADAGRDCPDDADPCTVAVCEPSGVQQIETSWLQCRDALASINAHPCASTAVTAASAPSVDQCIAQFKVRLESGPLAEELDALWSDVAQCIYASVGCALPSPGLEELAQSQQRASLICSRDEHEECVRGVGIVVAAEVAACILLGGGLTVATAATCVLVGVVSYSAGLNVCVLANSCRAEQLCCDQSCIDRTESNCAACGNTCGACEFCDGTGSDRSCQTMCDGPTTCCGNACVDYRCPPDQVFDSASCDCICLPGLTECNGECVTATCTAGGVFNPQRCACDCPPGAVQCPDGTCHSGICDTGMEFDASACECNCIAGAIPCGDGCVPNECPEGTPINPETCQCTECAAGTVACGGDCVSNVCTEGKSFSAERCQCDFNCQFCLAASGQPNCEAACAEFAPNATQAFCAAPDSMSAAACCACTCDDLMTQPGPTGDCP